MELNPLIHTNITNKKTTSKEVVLSPKKDYFLNGKAYFTIRLITLPYCLNRLALL